jgi:hypothetical protein
VLQDSHSITGLSTEPKGQDAQKPSYLNLLELPVKELLRRGNMRVEKCELRDAGYFFEAALEKAKVTRDHRGMSDSLAQLLRYSSEIGDEPSTQKWVNELEMFLAQNDGKLSPYGWYCKGIVAFRGSQFKKAQILFHRFWREVEAEENAQVTPDLELHREHMRAKAQALLALAVVANAQGKKKRAQYFGEVILNYAERERPRGILSSTYLMLCRIAERSGDTAKAKLLLQKAFAESVSEHNWYHYLFVLYGFARVSRMEQDFIQARFYLDLLEKAVVQEEFKHFKHEIA